jgi:site-specific recombinase XerD
LLFLYREVLDTDLPWMQELARPTTPRRIPAVLTVEEVRGLLGHMEGETALLARQFAQGFQSRYTTFQVHS